MIVSLRMFDWKKDEKLLVVNADHFASEEWATIARNKPFEVKSHVTGKVVTYAHSFTKESYGVWSCIRYEAIPGPVIFPAIVIYPTKGKHI